MKSINDNPKSKVKHHICLQCSLYENQERFPFIASKAIEGVLDDKNAEILIVKDLKFGTKKVIFNKILDSMKQFPIRNIDAYRKQRIVKIKVIFFKRMTMLKERITAQVLKHLNWKHFELGDIQD